MSAIATISTNVDEVFKSNGSKFLGRHFSVESNIEHRVPVSELISELELYKEAQWYKRVSVTLKLLAAKETSKASSVATAVLRPEQKCAELQDQLSLLILAKETLAMDREFFQASIDSTYWNQERAKVIGVLAFGSQPKVDFHFKLPKSLEAFAFYCRWIDVIPGSRFLTINSKVNPRDLEEFDEVRKSHPHPEVREQAETFYIYTRATLELNRTNVLVEKCFGKAHDIWGSTLQNSVSTFRQFCPMLAQIVVDYQDYNRKVLKEVMADPDDQLLDIDTMTQFVARFDQFFDSYPTIYQDLYAQLEALKPQCKDKKAYFGFFNNSYKWLSGGDRLPTKIENLRPKPFTPTPVAKEKPKKSVKLPVEPISQPLPTPSAIRAVLKKAPYRKGIDYHERVSQWFESPEQALSAEKYKHLPTHHCETVVWKHAFSPLLDLFVGTEYSVQGKWENKNATLIFIPAEIEEDGQTYRGGFQYTFTEEGVCYHRCWGSLSNDALIDGLLNDTLWKAIDFPSLEEASSPSKKSESTFESIRSCQVSLDSASKMITILDGERKITLFRMGRD